MYSSMVKCFLYQRRKARICSGTEISWSTGFWTLPSRTGNPFFPAGTGSPGTWGRYGRPCCRHQFYLFLSCFSLIISSLIFLGRMTFFSRFFISMASWSQKLAHTPHPRQDVLSTLATLLSIMDIFFIWQ